MNAIAQASTAPVTGPKLDNRRVVAGIVDLLIVAAGAVVVLFAADALTPDGGDIQGALGAVILGWALYYHFALESGGGQTVGKKLMKLRVVRADGSPVGMREVAVRTVLRVIDGAGAYIVGLIVMLATGQRRQRLGDLAAGTIVVDASEPAAMPVMQVVEPADATAGFEEPAAEAPAAGPEPKTITLPSRPLPPATVSDLAAPEAPAVPELRPFPALGEDVPVEAVEDEPAEAAEEPVEDEPVAEQPVAEQPVAADPVEEPLPAISSPVIEELAQDVATVQAEDEQAADEPVVHVGGPAVEVEPVVHVEDEIVEDEADEDEVVEDEVVEDEVVEDDPFEDDGPVTVKSVETVSAIDLIMGGAPEEQGSEESAPDPEDAAS